MALQPSGDLREIAIFQDSRILCDGELHYTETKDDADRVDHQPDVLGPCDCPPSLQPSQWESIRLGRDLMDIPIE